MKGIFNFLLKSGLLSIVFTQISEKISELLRKKEDEQRTSKVQPQTDVK